MFAAMRLPVVVVLLMVAGSTAALGQEPTAAAPQPLTVELASGRKFTGLVDIKTNDQYLVLRFTRGGASLKRPIEWSRIVKASVEGQPIAAETLRATAEGMKSQEPGVGDRESEVENRDGEDREGEAPAEPELPGTVASVTFDARLANWDGDVETDGLMLDVLPLSEDGYLLPARGTVEVELFAPQHRVFHHAPLSGGDTLERVERWTVAVAVEDFTANGARLKLPFGAVHPEFDWDWTPVGLAHVRLVVPGDGVFEDSLDGLRIRPYAPNRDRYEMNRGRRFVPTERVGRHG
jgi:hypothetical protein